MPYSVKKRGDKYEVVTTATGAVHGKHGTRAAALAQLRALYANAKEAKK